MGGLSLWDQAAVCNCYENPCRVDIQCVCMLNVPPCLVHALNLPSGTTAAFCCFCSRSYVFDVCDGEIDKSPDERQRIGAQLEEWIIES